jgi:HTH-type transcriptional regulator, quorum sensing regulator NprR
MAKGFTQKSLSEGICSPSYLSKIESGELIPKEDIKKLLFIRLGIDTQNNDPEIEKKLHNLYWLILNDELETVQNKLLQLKSNGLTGTLKVKYHLFNVFFALKKHNFTLAEKIMKDISLYDPEITAELAFYTNKAKGIYYYHLHDYKKAHTFFSDSLKYSATINIIDIEKAYLLYCYALSACQVGNNESAIDTARRSLSLFQSSYMYKRCIDCHVLIGVLNKKFFNYTESLSHYKISLELAKQHSYHSIIPVIKQNMGIIYFLMGRYNDAYQLLSGILRDEIIQDEYAKIQTILSLVKVLYSLRRLEEGLNWLEKGISILNKNSILTCFNLEYEFFNLLFKGKIDILEKKFSDEIIPMLDKSKKYSSLAEYAAIIGNCYYDIGKYKNAAKHFKISNIFLKKSINHLGE